MTKKKLLFSLSIMLFLLFIVVSFYVHKNAFAKIDFNTTVKLQDHISRKFDLPFSLISLLGSAEVTFIIWLALLIYFGLKKYWKVALTLLLFPLSQLLEIYGKTFVYHPAPPYLFYRGALPFNFPSSFIQTNYSYPSGHATRLTFLVIFLIFVFYLKLKQPTRLVMIFISLLFLLLVYVSRIYLAEHWLSDVLGGMLLGGALGIISGLSLKLMDKNS